VKLLAAPRGINKSDGEPLRGTRIVYFALARSSRAESGAALDGRSGQKHPGKIRKRRAAVARDGRTEKGEFVHASAAEQLAANVNLSAFGKAEELKQRIWFTLAALSSIARNVHSAARHRSDAFAKSFFGQSKGVLELFNMFAGGAVQRRAIFALNIMPYISASIIIQLLTSVCRRWKA